MSLKSTLRNIVVTLFNRKNFNFLIVGLIIIIFVFLAIGNYDLQFKEGMDVQIITPDKKLNQNFQQGLEVESMSTNSSTNIKKQSDGYTNRNITLQNSLIEEFTEGMSNKNCKSNYSDPIGNGSNELYDNVCNSVKTLDESNESLLNGETTVV